ncbi:hypothetical protein F5B22DRAFT_659869 [Xylaria bambusicola]|uniref:uncharacterized protein n=1 Tax=Xylaria bambusicola TaxID=326684 RepID=UPI002008D7E1|nr:uncharacterized protein F5B22DRAFT_659869 [Xylaria bambusicola]KAI0506813.1 hypothetical protein F5B22DRAFT_659869 [Xylaria bambusicola]
MAFTDAPHHLLDNAVGRDGLEYDESMRINKRNSLENFLEPSPCYSEPYDGWLVNSRGLQDADSTAVGIGLPLVPVLAQQLCYKDDREDLGRCWEQMPMSSTSASTASLNDVEEEEDRVENTTGDTTPTPTQCSCSLDEVSSGRLGSTGCTTLLYGWQEAPLSGDQPTFGVQNTVKAIEGLKEMERYLQTNTKQRISQIKRESLEVKADSRRGK